jgi:hypothetical protein
MAIVEDLKKTFSKFTELKVQSYAILIFSVIGIMISLFNNKLNKQIPVLLIVNGFVSIFVVECLVEGKCETMAWIFVVFNCLLILGLTGIFQTDLSFNVNTLLINKKL